jgi:class 3 adenylate cyclase
VLWITSRDPDRRPASEASPNRLRVLAVVLFADIVSATEQAAQLDGGAGAS